MATLTIRDLDDEVKARLRVRAAHNGRSMEAEARAILRTALTEHAPRRGLGSQIHQHFVDLDEDAGIVLPARMETPRAADFS